MKNRTGKLMKKVIYQKKRESDTQKVIFYFLEKKIWKIKICNETNNKHQ